MQGSHSLDVFGVSGLEDGGRETMKGGAHGAGRRWGLNFSLERARNKRYLGKVGRGEGSTDLVLLLRAKATMCAHGLPRLAGRYSYLYCTFTYLEAVSPAHMMAFSILFWERLVH
jgi:hypothetical protein